MKFTHIDTNNNPTMVDISDKSITGRRAVAKSRVELPNIIAQKISASGELNLKKGAVFQTAIIAGTMAVKRTSTLIPFCHPLHISSVKIHITKVDSNLLDIICEVKVDGKTGVEMEALTGASIAALTVYDMCKALSHEIKIKDTCLIHKSGGRSNIVDGKLCD